MKPTLQQFGIDRLSVDERLDLIHQIWDSITATEANPSIPNWQIRELERRMALAKTDLKAGMPWEVALARLTNPL